MAAHPGGAPSGDLAAEAVPVPGPLGSACSAEELASSEEMCLEVRAALESEDVPQDKVMEFLQWIWQDVLELALSTHGCRVVQSLLGVVGSGGRDALVAELFGSTVELYKSQNGNHVLTRAIEVVPASSLGAVIQAIDREGFWVVARHPYGCRVLERLIEHSCEEQMRGLIDQLVGSADQLCKHRFANFVIKHILEHRPERRLDVVERLLPEVPYLSTHRMASHVVQQALGYGGPEAQRKIACALLNASSPYSLVEVATLRYGKFVVEEFSKGGIAAWISLAVRNRLEAAPAELHSCPHFKRVAEAFELQLLPSASESDHESRCEGNSKVEA